MLSLPICLRFCLLEYDQVMPDMPAPLTCSASMPFRGFLLNSAMPSASLALRFRLADSSSLAAPPTGVPKLGPAKEPSPSAIRKMGKFKERQI